MAQTLKFGSGTWATKKGSTLAYSDEGGNFKPLPFTYTGAGKGTRVNKEGLIEVVENDRPRIDYLDSEDGVFLLEKAATNLVTYSEDFTEWNLSSSGNGQTPILTSNYTTNLGLNASRIIFNRTSKSTSNISSIRGNDYTQSTNTFSIYIKSNTRNVNIDFRLGSSIVTYEVTNEWKRMEFSGSDFYRSYFGLLGSSSDLYADLSIVAAQAEVGNVASSYIPTQGSIQTRVAETASGSGNSGVFNSQEGVLFLDTKALSNDGTTRTIGLSDGSNSNRIHFINYAVSNGYSVNYRVSNSTQVAFTEVGNVLDYQKIAFKYKSGDFSLWYNGFEIDTDDNTTMMAENTLDRLSFRQEPNSLNYYGKTKEIGYYDEILTDLELETLTSYRSWLSMVKELNLNIIHNE